MPSMREQKNIIHHLDFETGRIDALSAEAHSGIELLQERRSALISAAVTGKIDVRGWSIGAQDGEPELPMCADQNAGYTAQGGAA